MIKSEHYLSWGVKVAHDLILAPDVAHMCLLGTKESETKNPRAVGTLMRTRLANNTDIWVKHLGWCQLARAATTFPHKKKQKKKQPELQKVCTHTRTCTKKRTPKTLRTTNLFLWIPNRLSSGSVSIQNDPDPLSRTSATRRCLELGVGLITQCNK